MARTRWEGTRWSLVFGSYQGVERHAVTELQRQVQYFVPYVLEVYPAKAELLRGDHLVLVGTAKNNRHIAELVRRKVIAVPDEPEGYALRACVSPWNGERRLLVVAGRDAEGVARGVHAFNAALLRRHACYDLPANRRLALDEPWEFAESDYPRIRNRGIWTWGYVIYDYRRFLDHMAKLRMNMLTVWNHAVPLNIAEIRDYAHARGIRLILGFHWGWGLEKEISVFTPEGRARVKAMVLENYRRNYRGLGIDGIYFQTQTEHRDTERQGRRVAAVVCEMVNGIARELLREEPGLYIQAGLHATSILRNYTDFRPLDRRIAIVWEDAGTLPYTYSPALADRHPNGTKGRGLDTFAGTLAFSKKLATFRPGTEFGMVPKGWTALDWGQEFEFHGPFLLGERAPAYIEERRRRRRRYLDWVDRQWVRLYPRAMEFYRGILACRPARMTVIGLVEDGNFEATIPLSVALFAETIWNPAAGEAEILERAQSPYFSREDG